MSDYDNDYDRETFSDNADWNNINNNRTVENDATRFDNEVASSQAASSQAASSQAATDDKDNAKQPDAWNAFTSFVGSKADDLKNAAGAIKDETVKILEPVTKAVEQELSPIKDAVVDTLKQNLQSASEALKPVLQEVSSVAAGVADDAKQDLHHLSQETQKTLQVAADGVNFIKQTALDITAEAGKEANQKLSEAAKFAENTSKLLGDLGSNTIKTLNTVEKDFRQSEDEHIADIKSAVQNGDWGKAILKTGEAVREEFYAPIYAVQQMMRAANNATWGDQSKTIEKNASENLATPGSSVEFSIKTSAGINKNFIGQIGDKKLTSGEIGLGGEASTQSKITITNSSTPNKSKFTVTAEMGDLGYASASAGAKYDGKKQNQSEILNAEAALNAGVGAGSKGTYDFASKEEAIKGAQTLQRYMRDPTSFNKEDRKFLADNRTSHMEAATARMSASAGVNIQTNLNPFGARIDPALKPGFIRAQLSGGGSVADEISTQNTFVFPKGNELGKLQIAVENKTEGKSVVGTAIGVRSSGASNTVNGMGDKLRFQASAKESAEFTTGTGSVKTTMTIKLTPQESAEFVKTNGKVSPEAAARILADRTVRGAGIDNLTVAKTDVNGALFAVHRPGFHDTYSRTTTTAKFNNPKPQDIAKDIAISGSVVANSGEWGPTGNSLLRNMSHSNQLNGAKVTQLSEQLERQNSADRKTTVSLGIADVISLQSSVTRGHKIDTVKNSHQYTFSGT